MASLAFCVALAMMTSAISSIAEATDAGDWYVDLGKSETTGSFFIGGNDYVGRFCLGELPTDAS